MRRSAAGGLPSRAGRRYIDFGARVGLFREGRGFFVGDYKIGVGGTSSKFFLGKGSSGVLLIERACGLVCGA